jgi:hypothetical protein
MSNSDTEGALYTMDGKMFPALDAYVAAIQALSDHYLQEVTPRRGAAAARSADSGRELLRRSAPAACWRPSWPPR